MSVSIRTPARAALALALMLVASAAAAQDRDAPRVSADRNGRTEVVVDGDCVVNFNARGERVRNSARCRDGQLRRAERADNRYREELAAAAAQRDRDGGREPRITLQRDGQARVDVGRDCDVAYDAYGRRRAQSPGCGNGELARADRAIADYRRQNGLDRTQRPGVVTGIPGVVRPIPGTGGPGDERPGHGKGHVTMTADGGSVAFTNGCVVTYAVDGRRRGGMRLCSAGQLGRADELMFTYRSLQQVPSGGS